MAWLPAVLAGMGAGRHGRSQWRDRPGFAPEFLGGRSLAILSQPCGKLKGVFAQIVTVAGLGAEGWQGLPTASRDAIGQAAVIVGAPRQLALLPAEVPGRRVPLPSPLLPGLRALIDEHAGTRSVGAGLVVLASGDPMFYGIGVTLVRLLGAERVRVLPHPSSVSLAAARLGWALDDTDVVSLVGRPPELLHPLLQPGRRVLVLTAEPSGAADVRAVLDARGFGASPVTLLADLGGPDEQVAVVGAGAGDPHSRLAIVAVECRLDPAAAPLPRVPGLPDDAFEHDGQLTKRELRACALAALAPVPGQLLWDVGAGSGSVGIEWMRVHPASRAIAVEPRADRRERITRNAAALGVPGLTVVAGEAPRALAGLPAPDAVFIGGGVTAPGVVGACLDALGPGGRLVANAVTIEGQAVLAEWRQRLGGSLTRIGVEHAGGLGSFTAWRPALAVVQWSVRKAAHPPDAAGHESQEST
jgi:precorrin-6B C5,15-methyltransferase / cobalt-precorrin-6B C5,C15-methyltransferase